jgi:hypothetical protein
MLLQSLLNHRRKWSIYLLKYMNWVQKMACRSLLAGCTQEAVTGDLPAASETAASRVPPAQGCDAPFGYSSHAQAATNRPTPQKTLKKSQNLPTTKILSSKKQMETTNSGGHRQPSFLVKL